MNDQILQKVDHAALRTNQSFIIGLSIAAFVLNAAWLAALVALVMAVGTYRRVPGFGFVYQRLLKPRGWVKPDVLQDNPEPHRFAQGFGAVVLGIAVAALFLGASILGWALVWLVVALAALNLFLGFCAGCAVYYWLSRLSVPGFAKSPPPGAIPGMRPKAPEGGS
jgi:sterol desaturase/sphingolipid hydroxylase (fatty acid hydroxylase superfamily)